MIVRGPRVPEFARKPRQPQPPTTLPNAEATSGFATEGCRRFVAFPSRMCVRCTGWKQWRMPDSALLRSRTLELIREAWSFNFGSAGTTEGFRVDLPAES